MLLRTLGGLGLEGSPFTRPKPLLLLAYLALEGPQERRHLAELFWPEAADHMKSLSVALTQLRRGVPGATEADEVRVRTAIATDASLLLDALSLGNTEEAINCYQGAFLEGVKPVWGVELEEWIYQKRELIAREIRKALIGTAETEAAQGRFDTASRIAERAFRLAGAPAPEPEDLVRLHTLLLAGDSLYTTEVAEETRGFDLPAPSDREAARASFRKADLTVPNNLPARLQPLIGREKDLNAATKILEDPAVQLLTLLGPGGIGKTSLGLKLARDQSTRHKFKDGVFLVLLGSLKDATLVSASIAQALAVKETSAMPFLERIKEFLLNKEILLVLDNFEQVMPAALQVSELLGACPNLKCIVTSRMPLRLSGEYEFPLTPLTLPTQEDISDFTSLRTNPALALFVERAQAVRPDFNLDKKNAEALVEICRRLDGLPLALELAAVRIKLFSPQTILERLNQRFELLKGGLRDRPERHQTLRAAVDWSYELLSREEQAFFRRLGVFVGGFTLEMAQRLQQELGQSIEVMDAVAALIENSLLSPGRIDENRDRFFMLSTLRDYALVRLEEADELKTAQRAHAKCYLELVESVEPELTGPEQGRWFAELEREHDNFRAALAWSESVGECEIGLRIGASLWRFWIARGHMQEGYEQLQRLLDRDTEEHQAVARARALNGLATILHELGHYTRAIPLLEESLTLLRQNGQDREIATILNNQGWIAALLGDYAKSLSLSEEALLLHQSHKNVRGEALSLNNLGYIAVYRGDPITAAKLFAEGLALRRRLADRRGIAYALTNLAWAKQLLGKFDRSASLLEGALVILHELEDKQLTAWALNVQGYLDHDLERSEKAAASLQQSVALWREVGNNEGLASCLIALGAVWIDLGRLEQASRAIEEGGIISQAIEHTWNIALSTFTRAQLAHAQGDTWSAVELYRESLARYQALGNTGASAICLEGWARVSVIEGKLELAAHLYGAAEALRERCQIPLPSRNLPTYRQDLALLHKELDKDRLEANWLAGRKRGADGSYTLCADPPRR
ncbi:MAG: tetratricopeptide repeat protein [Trueperaceae bacterium]|nr:MAG: tetratricopeptide repeat protein [Trueperaceae bacterium]